MVKLTNMRITAAVILFGFMDFIMLWVLLFGSETSCFLADQGAGGAWSGGPVYIRAVSAGTRRDS